MKKIAIAGLGTVGGGVARLLTDNRKVLMNNAGEEITLGAVLVRSIKTDSEYAHLMTTDFSDIENDPYVNLKKIGRRLKATHVHDNCGKCDDHIAPFDGNINWERVMRALYEIDYKYSFTYEAHNAVVRIPKEAPLIADKKLRYLYELGVTLVSWDPEKGFVDSELNL